MLALLFISQKCEFPLFKLFKHNLSNVPFSKKNWPTLNVLQLAVTLRCKCATEKIASCKQMNSVESLGGRPLSYKGQRGISQVSQLYLQE